MPPQSSSSSSAMSAITPNTTTATATKPLISKSWKVKIQHQHSYTGGRIVLSHSEQFLACWCNGDITLLNISSGTVFGRIVVAVEEDSEDVALTFALHPNDTTIAVATSRSMQIRVYDISQLLTHIDTPNYQQQLDDIRTLHTGFRPHSNYPALYMQYDTTGMLLATASVDHTVRVFSTANNYDVTHILRGHTTTVSRLYWYPHNSKRSVRLCSCSEDGEIRVWELVTSKCVATLSNHMSVVTDITFDSVQPHIMYSVSRDKVTSVWDLNDYTCKHTIPVYDTLEACVALPADAVVPSESATTTLADDKANVSSADAATTSYYLTGAENGQLKVWNSRTRKIVYTHYMPGAKRADSQPSTSTTTPTTPSTAAFITYLLYGRQSHTLIVVTGEHNIYCYTPTHTHYQRTKLLIGYNDEILDILHHPTSQQLYVATNSRDIKRFHSQTLDADILASPDGHTDVVLSIDVSPDGRWLVSSSKDNSVRFWSTLTNQCVGVAIGHTEAVGCVKFCVANKNGSIPDKLWAVSGARDRTIKQWDCDALHQLTDEELQSTTPRQPLQIPALHTKLVHAKDINCITISPNNKLIATGSQDKRIAIVQPTATDEGLTVVTHLDGHTRGVWSLAFSSYDKVLASGSGDTTIRLWNMSDYSCIKTLQGHTHNVLQVNFINIGMQLLSAGADGLFKVWSIKQAECLNTYESHDGKVWAMSVLNDNAVADQSHATRMCVTGGDDSVLRIWEDVTVAEHEEAVQLSALRHRQEQALNNLIRQKKYGAAMLVALDLKQPRNLFNMLQNLCTPTLDNEYSAAVEVGNHNAVAAILEDNINVLTDIIKRLDAEKLNILLDYCQQWNTNNRFSSVAHTVLRIIFQSFTPQSLLQCSALRNNLDSFILYSQRHFNRVGLLQQKSYLIDYTYQQMRLLRPASENMELEEQTHKLLPAVGAVQNGVDGGAKAAPLPTKPTAQHKRSAPPPAQPPAPANGSKILSSAVMAGGDDMNDNYEIDEADAANAFSSNWAGGADSDDSSASDADEKRAVKKKRVMQERREHARQSKVRQPRGHVDTRPARGRR